MARKRRPVSRSKTLCGGREIWGRLRRNAELDPRLERLVPQHRERRAVVLDEVLGLSEAVLRAEPDDLDIVGELVRRRVGLWVEGDLNARYVWGQTPDVTVSTPGVRHQE